MMIKNKITQLTAIMLLSAVLSPSVLAYELVIKNPQSSRPYLKPAQSIEVDIDINPRPTPLHTLVVSLNGEPVAINQKNFSLNTADYNPNEYLLKADLQDETGRVIASDSRTIYIIINNPLIKKQRAEAKAKAAYDALPWYKKITIRLRQDGVVISN